MCIVLLSIFVFLGDEISDPCIVFLLLWIVIMFLYSINLYDLPQIDNTTESIISIAIISYMIGSQILGNISRVNNRLCLCIRHRKPRSILRIVNDIHNNRLLLFLKIVGVLILLYTGKDGLYSVLSGKSLAYIRYTLRIATIKEGANGLLLTYIATPILYFSIAYDSACFATNINNGSFKNSYFLTIIMIVMEIMTSGGRLIVLYTLTCAFCGYIISMHIKKNTSIKQQLQYLIVLIICIFLMYAMVASRGNKNDVIKSTITYLYAPISALRKYITIFTEKGYSYCFGFLSLQGFTRIFFKLIGLDNIAIVASVDRAYTLIDSAIYLNNMIFNSAITFIGYFYFDGGWIGVIIGSLLYGLVCKKCYLRVFSEIEIKLSSICIYMSILCSILFSFTSFLYASPGCALSLFILLLLKKSGINHIEIRNV